MFIDVTRLCYHFSLEYLVLFTKIHSSKIYIDLHISTLIYILYRILCNDLAIIYIDILIAYKPRAARKKITVV